jgi:hypothetical protein
MLFPTTLVQEELETSAQRKLSLLDRLLGKLQDGKQMKEQYVKLLMANPQTQGKGDMLVEAITNEVVKSSSSPLKILDQTLTKPDPEKVKRLIGLHPVHQVSEYTPEGIKEEKLLKRLLLLQ